MLGLLHKFAEGKTDFSVGSYGSAFGSLFSPVLGCCVRLLDSTLKYCKLLFTQKVSGEKNVSRHSLDIKCINCILAIIEITVISARVLVCVWQMAASLSVGLLCEYRRTHQNICIRFQR